MIHSSDGHFFGQFIMTGLDLPRINKVISDVPGNGFSFCQGPGKHVHFHVLAT